MNVSPNDYFDALTCPHCGGECLHQGNVTVACPINEDNTQEGYQVAVNENAKSASLGRTTSFRGRRSEINIEFSCEDCVTKLTLYIMQHKGSTYMGWNEELS
jgi:hypothetical protein